MIRLAIIFGSRSVEHEVSIITATQLMREVDPAKYEVVPIYIDKRGSWWTGEVLKDTKTFQTLDLQNPHADGITAFSFSPDPTVDHGMDVAIFCTHGGHGEDGTLAGLFELADVPYAAPGVVAAAVAIDKIISKHVFAAADIPSTKYIWFTREEWLGQKESILARAQTNLTFPMFVKPAGLGSSVGVTKVDSSEALADAIDLAAAFDTRLLIEEAANDCIEVNVSVIGTNDEYEVSTTEEPFHLDTFLSYADKYERGSKKGKKAGMASLDRQIPAPISHDLSEKIKSAAQQVWRLIGGTGVARIDFFADPSSEQFFIGEVNAPPGSMAYYLWEASGRSYTELIDHLATQALKRASTKKSLMHSIESNILSKNSDE